MRRKEVWRVTNDGGRRSGSRVCVYTNSGLIFPIKKDPVRITTGRETARVRRAADSRIRRWYSLMSATPLAPSVPISPFAPFFYFPFLSFSFLSSLCFSAIRVSMVGPRARSCGVFWKTLIKRATSETFCVGTRENPSLIRRSRETTFAASYLVGKRENIVYRK